MKKTLAAAALSTMAFADLPARADDIKVNPVGPSPSIIADPKNFSGNVVVDLLLPASIHTPASSGLVSFGPGARTAWYSHPLGQMLIVTAGKGWLQRDGKQRQEITQGQTVSIPAGVKHWHGATTDNAMSHYAITYVQDGKNADWMELVTDEYYRGQ